jgi:hypothetical protein
LFTGLSNASTYYVRIASGNFSGAGLLTSWISVAGNGLDNGTDHDDNGVDDTATTTNGIKKTRRSAMVVAKASGAAAIRSRPRKARH